MTGPTRDPKSPSMPKAADTLLPPAFRDWFAARGWEPRAHQLALLEAADRNASALLVAPTGAGKTLAGFLPSLTKLARKRNRRGLHTLYLSPLKALAVDIARNLEAPVCEMNLPIRIETRTGDTSAHKKARQKTSPPDILLTTPEQLSLLLSHKDADEFFGTLDTIILDELHALVTSKRGDLLSLALSRLWALAPQARMVGLSATVREPETLARFLVPQDGVTPQAEIVTVKGGARPRIGIMETARALPLAGHTALAAMGEIYHAIEAHKLSLVFVNTRMQAEFVFQELWRINEQALPIGLHHGSLDASQRRKVEAAMSAGQLRAVVCTSTLDLGIDWGDVDCVINVGAPKGASRLMQRIGRANHRLDEPSKAILVPANRFEILECRAALDAVEEAAQDTPDPRIGALDVLAQHILGMACAAPFDAGTLFAEITHAQPYETLTRARFDAVLDFVATGGYALKNYDRFARIRQGADGRWRVSNPRMAQQYRMNIGTIIEATMLKVRLGRMVKGTDTLRGGRILGEVEDYFAETLAPGDTFIFAGEVLRFEGIATNEVIVTRSKPGTDPKIPSWAGGKFPLSTFLAARVRAMIAAPAEWKKLPKQASDWLAMQQKKSLLPPRDKLLVETYPRGNRYYCVIYSFEGRLAHQTLGMLLTRRLERLRLKPLGFVCNDYALAIWGMSDLSTAIAKGRLDLDALFARDMLGDDLEEWLDESALMKRTFRNCAIISGLTPRRFPGDEKTGRQMTISTDLIYDVLRRHQPDHILLQAAREDAATGLLDLKRLSDMLARVEGKILHKPLDRVSPLAISVMLEIGREAVYGEAADTILEEAEAALMDEALA